MNLSEGVCLHGDGPLASGHRDVQKLLFDLELASRHCIFHELAACRQPLTVRTARNSESASNVLAMRGQARHDFLTSNNSPTDTLEAGRVFVALPCVVVLVEIQEQHRAIRARRETVQIAILSA